MPARAFLIAKIRRLWYKKPMITERPNNSRSPNDDAYEEALDRLVDTKNISYDDARRELGEPPYEVYELGSVGKMGAIASRSVVRPRRRRRSGHGPQFGEEEGVGYPGGLPPYYQPYVPLSDEQKAVNLRGVAAAREELQRRTKV
jgi:hypothetical protein